MNKYSANFILCFHLVVIMTSCRKSESSPSNPSVLFESELINPMPVTCRPFDSKITPRKDGVTVWVAFDCGAKEWEKMRSALSIKKRHDYYLNYATGRTPNDTGFEGYIDDDYELLRDEVGRNFYVRKLKDGVRVVYFYRK